VVKEQDSPTVEELIEAIMSKLNANKDVLRKGLDSGTLEWDLVNRGINKGKFNVKLRPRL